MADTKLSKLASCPLDPVWDLGVHGQAGSPGITLERVTPHALAQVTHWPGKTRAFQTAIGKVQMQLVGGVAKTTLPATGCSVSSGNFRLSDLGGGRHLIESASADLVPALRDNIASATGTVTDLSDARVILKITGASVRWVFSKLLPIDYDPISFEVGQFHQSSIHHMPVFVHRESETEFRIGLFTTYAESVHALLTDAALEVGLKRV